jgi:hypothetical protein
MEPLARRDGLIVETLVDEILVYDLESHRAHCLNETAAVVWRHCDGQTSVRDLAARAEQELGTPVDEAVAWLALDQLDRARLLSEPVSRPARASSFSRRDLLRKAGLVGAALAAPAVVSIVAPSAAQAQSCTGMDRPMGCPCGMNNDCASNMCNSMVCE